MLQERASKKQQELLRFVDGFIKGNGYGPSYREIMKALGYKSVSTVAIHIDGLIAKGYLARRDKSARSLEVVTLQGGSFGPVPSSSDDTFETKLIQRVDGADLTSEQQQIVRQAFVLLGLDSVAATIQLNESDRPPK